MRGGLDDALDKLARRDELRRRATGEADATPLAVQELVEAIATVVGRNPKLEVTVGVEGVGDPTLLHFYVEEGTVRVTADQSVAARAGDAAHRHADFDLDPEEHTVAPPPPEPRTAHVSYDDRDRYDPGTGYDMPGGYPHPQPAGYDEDHTETLDAAQFRSPFAPTPPPRVPPQYAPPRQAAPEPEPEPENGGLTPLPEPIPLRDVDTQETEQAAKRLAALLRDDPTLLRQDRQ
ncbi:hypothetical protein [Actinoplanes sp. NPDC089786]|uniref:hypothetical protein n=1 Tax=Actinoplanes sp. NPDC089786 TaxID=3155185 RepID=UPI00341FD3DF